MNKLGKRSLIIVALLLAGIVCYLYLVNIDSPDGPILISTTGSAFTYSPSEVYVYGGSEVIIDYWNYSIGEPHNWVLVNGDDSVAKEVAIEAAAHVGYLPPKSAKVIIMSPILSNGQGQHMQFIPPPPGRYTFLCTFPGHYDLGMKGTLIAMEKPR